MNMVNKKNIALLVFPDKLIISQISYLVQEEIGDCDLLLTEPFVVTIPQTKLLTEEATNQEYILTPWLIEYTTENKFQIHSDKLITITQPSPKLLYQYEEAIL